MTPEGSRTRVPANPWVPVSGCGASCIRHDAERIGRWRFTGRLTALAAVASLGVLIATGALLCGRRVRARYCRGLSRWMLAAAGLRLDVVDHRPPQSRRLHGALVVANHISCLDIPAIAALGPARFVAKREVLTMGGRAARPIAAVLRRLGVLAHSRGDLRGLPGDVDRVAGILDRGLPVVVFPEGTTWCGIGAGRFRPAFFQAAIDAGVPVLPVQVRYHRRGTAVTGPGYVGEDSLVDTLRRVLWARGLTVQVTVHAGQLPVGGRRELADRCAGLIFDTPMRLRLRGARHWSRRTSRGYPGRRSCPSTSITPPPPR